jgi:ABC-type uncharacterized transport system YnjBCD substrate-binding protein
MQRATEHYRALGYVVRDTSAGHPWDLEVSRASERRRVEVKATQSDGHAVILTAGEVNAARESGICTDLFVVSRLSVEKVEGQISVTGGTTKLIPNWPPADADLTPTEFRYRMPSASF